MRAELPYESGDSETQRLHEIIWDTEQWEQLQASDIISEVTDVEALQHDQEATSPELSIVFENSHLNRVATHEAKSVPGANGIDTARARLERAQAYFQEMAPLYRQVNDRAEIPIFVTQPVGPSPLHYDIDDA